MGIDNIWVFAEAVDGAPTSATLELLTKARSLGTASAFVVGDGLLPFRERDLVARAVCLLADDVKSAGQRLRLPCLERDRGGLEREDGPFVVQRKSKALASS